MTELNTNGCKKNSKKYINSKSCNVIENLHLISASGVGNILLFLLLQVSCCAYAKMDATNVDINITGTIVASASCTIDNKKPINIDYGDVYISDIDAGRYLEEIPYSITCKGDPEGKTIQMRLMGNTASFDTKILKTDVEGLGIKLLKNKTQILPNSWFEIFPDTPPLLEAEIVKENKVVLQNGKRFNASATLIIDYR